MTKLGLEVVVVDLGGLDGGLVRGEHRLHLVPDLGRHERLVGTAVVGDCTFTAELRRAEANHHDLDTLFPRLVAARGFDDAEDIACVLHYRVARATARPAGSVRTRKAPRLIAGLIPSADGPMTRDMRHALDERRELIETRAEAVPDTARDAGEAWTRPLGDPLRDPRKTAAWRRHARTVAAYRDRYGLSEDTPLGPVPENAAQKIDRARAETALRQLAGRSEPRQEHRPPAPTRQGPSL